MEIKDKDIKNLYLRAKSSFLSCITLKENEFLRDEINFSVAELLLEEEHINVKFGKTNADMFIVEVKINLYSSFDLCIGRYLYYEDESGIVVDDYLIFD